jgi:D-serine dehydratase
MGCPDDVKNSPARGLADEERVNTFRAETLVVSSGDRISGIQPGVHDRIGVADVSIRNTTHGVSRGSALISDAGGAVTGGDDGPATRGCLALRDAHGA